MKSIPGLFLLLCFSFQLSAETLPPANANFKGLWVGSFETTILGNATAEDELIAYAIDYGFNLLTCSNMYSILPDNFDNPTEKILQLRSFISKAHHAGIQYIGGNVGSSNTAAKVQNYNNSGTLESSEKIDMISYECEFYNDNTNGSCPSFESYISQVMAIRSICDNTQSSVLGNSLLFDIYIGGQGDTGAIVTYSSQAEMQQIAAIADLVSLTYYRSDPFTSGGNFFNNSIERLQWLSNLEDPTKIILLLKSRDTDSNNMFDYLVNYDGSHSQAVIDPYRCWVEGSAYNPTLTSGYIESFESGTMNWLAGIQIVGFTYFTYDANIEIEKIVTNTADISKEESFLYPNPSSGIYKLKGISPDRIENIEVYNSQGAKISDFKSTNINLSEYQSGFFIVRVCSYNNCFVQKILKE